MLSTAAVLLPRPAQAQTTAPSVQPAPASTAAPAAPQGSGSIDRTDTRIVSDPLYLPMKGQVYGATAYTLDMPKGDNFKNGTNTGAFTASDNLIDQTLAYGVTNALTVRMTLGYGSNNRDSTAATTGDVTTGNASGFNDPTFSATVRVLDQPRSSLILDVTASYSPDTFTSQSAGGTSNGTIARGGQTTGISFALGRVMPSFTVAATANSTYVGEQMTELLANNTSSDSAAHWSYSVGLNTQARFNDRVSLDVGATFSTAADYGVTNVQNGNPHTYAPPATRALNLALNYHVQPNVVAGFTYSYNNLTDATNTFAKATADTAVENRMSNVVGVRLLYAFN
jgi:hypothetical protein